MDSTDDRLAVRSNIPAGVEFVLRLAAAGVLIGMGLRGMLHDLPLRALFWDADWWTWFAQLFGYSWKEWVTSAAVDRGINVLDFGTGLFFLVTGLCILLVKKWQSLPNWLSSFILKSLFLSWFFLLIQYFLNFKEGFWQLGNLLEHSLQILALPLWFFVIAIKSLGWSGLRAAPWPKEWATFLRIIRLAIGFTFIGHGFYAVGIHSVPANFVLMTQSGLGVGESFARSTLLVVGILDFAAAALLFLPWKRIWLVALGWIIPWAVLTTLARLWSYGGLVDMHTLITQWIPEVIIRLPHILIPVALWLILRVRPAR